MRVLIAGANGADRLSLRTGLGKMVFTRLDEAGNLAECLERLDDENYTVLFLEVDLLDGHDVGVLDPMFDLAPYLQIVGYSRDARIQDAVEAMHMGVIDFVSLPFTEARLGVITRRLSMKRDERREHAKLLELNEGKQTPLYFESEDEVMVDAMDVAVRVAPTDATVLLLGESGTGKSVLARAIHEGSLRKSEDLVTVHCPSLSKELLESELFGHVRGAFTGAVSDKKGRVVEADGGTLFLDEIGELPMELQPKLLRLLQERSYERVGDTKTRHVDVRVISATNRDLEEEVRKGNFREDLYYRLNVIEIKVPGLRERQRDLVKIAEGYVRYFAKRLGSSVRVIDAGGLAAIRGHEWPGNLRELRNVVERAVILCRGDEIGVKDLGLGAVDEVLGGGYDLGLSLADVEMNHIERVIGDSDTIEEAAKVLGVNASTLYRKRKKLIR